MEVKQSFPALWPSWCIASARKQQSCWFHLPCNRKSIHQLGLPGLQSHTNGRLHQWPPQARSAVPVSLHDRSGKNRDVYLVSHFNYLPGSNQYKDFLSQMYLSKYVTTIGVYVLQKCVQSSLEPLWAFRTFNKHRISKHKYLCKPLYEEVNTCFPDLYLFPKEKVFKARNLKTELD